MRRWLDFGPTCYVKSAETSSLSETAKLSSSERISSVPFRTFEKIFAILSRQGLRQFPDWSPQILPSLPRLYPGCEIRRLDEVLLDRHVESHLAKTHGAADTEV